MYIIRTNETSESENGRRWTMAITLRRSLDRAPAIRRSLLVARTTIDPSASIDVEGRTLGHSEDLETGNTELEGRHPFNSRLFFLYPTRDDLHRDLSFQFISSRVARSEDRPKSVTLRPVFSLVAKKHALFSRLFYGVRQTTECLPLGTFLFH